MNAPSKDISSLLFFGLGEDFTTLIFSGIRMDTLVIYHIQILKTFFVNTDTHDISFMALSINRKMMLSVDEIPKGIILFLNIPQCSEITGCFEYSHIFASACMRLSNE
ncbi:hypothetical protein RF11_04849 [Thelohanellus kitauei]|uniref:Uncharacterized protein n=1 Tax=Thelohanellus kitauei TaxID=669202 RepID=A0A0C2NDP4_THEKT|nr:hypothetical protein RF11_04849 [Thelohanellus kitauei]